MSTFKAQIIADSIMTIPDTDTNVRLTTMQLRYPRFIHSEFMTHREFSRNASSSRAIPVKKLIEDARRDPVTPIHWGLNQPGMQAFTEIDGINRSNAIEIWNISRNKAIQAAEALADLNIHKQIINRILEPYTHINVVVTSTNWSNFFALRMHKDAEPHIQALANEMYKAYESSVPVVKFKKHIVETFDSLHLPYYNLEEGLDEATALKCSAARCARVSYLTHEGKKPEVNKDIELYNTLASSWPKHMSPLEHQGMVPFYKDEALNPKLTGNFFGWIQHRKLIQDEKIKEYKSINEKIYF